MNRQPPQSPNGRLDAEERALAARLPRPYGRTEPGPELDAAILSAAHAAIAPKPAPASKRHAVRQRRWILPASVAATVALAAGLSWQLRPPAMRTAPTPATSSAPVAEADGAMSVRMIEREVVAPPPPPPPLVVAPPTRGVAPPTPPPAVAATPTEPARETLDHFDDEATGGAAAEPSSPQPAAQMAEEAARASAPPMAKAAQAGAVSRERASTANNAAAQARDAAAEAVDATTLDTVTVVDGEEPDEDVPPATADSPDVRAAWLRRIGELLKQGKSGEAKASLDEFRRRYPDATIPPELRKLEP